MNEHSSMNTICYKSSTAELQRTAVFYINEALGSQLMTRGQVNMCPGKSDF